MFNLEASYKPAGDQPQAIKEILNQFSQGKPTVTLLGATGTGKTFTMANIIQSLQKPTLIISHNKTLAAQLATEFKYFFPKNAVHYFVSYFDYYQPESYLPEKDMYIEKEATINKEIEMYRLWALASLLSRQDVIIVASVSALYGLWQKEYFQKYSLTLQVGKEIDRDTFKRQLISMQYKPVQSKVEQGMFDIRWEMIDIFASTEKVVYRILLNEDTIEAIQVKDAITFKDLWMKSQVVIWPSSQYLQDLSDLQWILWAIEHEMQERVEELTKQGKQLEAQRLKKKVLYDTRLIKETGFTNWIENYSVYFDKRMPWEPPNTIFDYFPDDCLVIMDESHMSIPQLRAMPQGDRSRKRNLIEHGFRLPSAIDHRPLNFPELEAKLGRSTPGKSKKPTTSQVRDITSQTLVAWPDIELKKGCKTIFVSATPADYEIQKNPELVEQIIRPTGLLDPFTAVYPKSGDYQLLISSLDQLVKKKPHISEFLDWYEQEKAKIAEVFENNENLTESSKTIE